MEHQFTIQSCQYTVKWRGIPPTGQHAW